MRHPALAVLALTAVTLGALTACSNEPAVEPAASAPTPAVAPPVAPPPAPASDGGGPDAYDRAEAVTLENQIAYAAGLSAYADYDYAADGSDNPRYVTRDGVRLCDYIDAAEGDPVEHAALRFQTDLDRAAAIVEYAEQQFCTIPGVRP